MNVVIRTLALVVTAGTILFGAVYLGGALAGSRVNGRESGHPTRTLTSSVQHRCDLSCKRQRKVKAARTYRGELQRLLRKWDCVHRREGSWTGGGPRAFDGSSYSGGLQMDATFERTYGPEFQRKWGRAQNWPVWAQLTAAERGWQVRGWAPWPNTARACGLL